MQMGEANDYLDNLPLQCLHPVGHWYEVPNLLLATVDDVIFPPSAVVDTPGGAKRGSGDAGGGDEMMEKLTRLKAMRAKGLISAKDYEEKKKQLLDDM